MNKFFLIFVIIISGCAQLMNGQTQPTIKSLKFKNAFFTSCGGAVEDWGTCNRKAMVACPTGYTVLEKDTNSTGTKREIHFECRK